MGTVCIASGAEQLDIETTEECELMSDSWGEFLWAFVGVCSAVIDSILLIIERFQAKGLQS